MKKENVDNIIEVAKKYNKNKLPWHHHFLTPKCKFNRGKKYKLILENEKTGMILFSDFSRKPKKELKELDVLFRKLK